MSVPARSVRPLAGAAAWLRTRDPGYAALRRATRTALVMPAMFALGDVVIGNPILATFAAFGSFAMLLLVESPGTIRDRSPRSRTVSRAGAWLWSAWSGPVIT
ncbi:MAG: hypothetical protein ABI323_12365 [Solirubrobacteraceae bacterium]